MVMQQAREQMRKCICRISLSLFIAVGLQAFEASVVWALPSSVMIVTSEESRQPDAPRVRKGFRTQQADEGPTILFIKPANGEDVEKPVTIDIAFQPKDAPVDISSLEVTYLKLFPIDITDRVKAYAKPTGIKIDNAEFPSGTHKVKFAIKDSEGRLSETTLKITILDEPDTEE